MSLFHAGRPNVAERIVSVVGAGLVSGDDHVSNAVAVSFVEGYGAFDDETDAFLDLWPASLRVELGR